MGSRVLKSIGLLTVLVAVACSEDDPNGATEGDGGLANAALDGGATTTLATAIDGLGGSARPCSTRSHQGVDPSGGNRACAQCLLTNCKAPVQTAYGSDMNFFSGTCGTYSQCFCYCQGPSDAKCIDECAAKQDEVCRSDFAAVSSCRQSKCAAQCPSASGAGSSGGRSAPDAGTGTTGGSGAPLGSGLGGGPNVPECAALLKCCDAMTNPALVPGCKAVAAAGPAASCRATLSADQSAGLCPR